MEESSDIEAKNKEGISSETENDHAEAVALVEKNRDFFEHYAKGRIKIEPAPAGLGTFAFDLEKNTIYINSLFFKKMGLPEEKTIFATLHEIEHFMEKIQILSEEGGQKTFTKFLSRLKASRAFSLMDNCVADIRQNRAVISKTNKGMAELEAAMYQEDLFVETDFLARPRHIQFSEALLRESRVPGEKCQVAPEVRQALEEVAKVPNLLEVMTNPETPMSLRLKLQDKFIWPKVQTLLEQDIEEKKKQKEKDKKKGENGQNGDGESEESKGEKEGTNTLDGAEETAEGKGEEGEEEVEGGGNKEGNEKEEKDGDNENQAESGGEGKAEKGESEAGSENDEEEIDPNKIFAQEYEEEEKKFPEAIPLEKIEEAFKKWQEVQKNQNTADQLDEAYAQSLGVKKESLQDYRRLVESLEKIVNPETNLPVIEELRNLFNRIIAKRLKSAPAPKYPVSEGDELVDPAQLVADVKAGNFEPKVWEDVEIKEKKGDKFGEVEITLVCDRSGSMSGVKAEEQRKSAVLVMEALKEFAELCEQEKTNIDMPLEVRSEIYSFANSEDDKKPLKKMSPELSGAERISVLEKLKEITGTTTDFLCLEAIGANLSEQIKIKIKIAELKKIVIVFTDGESDDPVRVQVGLKNLRDDGVFVIGVGITSAGQSVLSTYAPEAQVVEDVSRLPLVLAELLKEHLHNL